MKKALENNVLTIVLDERVHSVQLWHAVIKQNQVIVVIFAKIDTFGPTFSLVRYDSMSCKK